MAKYEVTKTVEAQKLNPRTGIPLAQPATTLPYGAIIDNVEEAGDYYKFSYLTERYQIKISVASSALSPIGAAGEIVSEPAAAAEDPGPVKPLLAFESLRSRISLSRAKIPGGWLVANGSSVTFVPDEAHTWDGGSSE